MDGKTLFEIVTANPGNQYVLYFEDLSPVTVTVEDLNPDSTFFRRSKKRLGELFYCVDGGSLSSGSDDGAAAVTVYKTSRGRLSDYVLYESLTHEYIQTWINTKAKSRAHSHYKQVTINSLTSPSNPHVMDIYISNTDMGIQLSFKNDLFQHEFNPMVNLYPDIPWYYTGTIYALTIIQKYKDKVSKCILHYPGKDLRYRVYMLSTHRWKPYRYIEPFVNTMDKLKQELPDMDILFSAKMR